ncbi:pirin family protein [Aliivibrio wodanis]|uniref:pirin family protein n=1 Tax=Aliivibrio wodanis TaxID=80852 RepID=UPI00406C03D3
MFELRKANERGSANFGWLNAKHTFSFGHYYDVSYMGFGPLRVINEDRVKPEGGFATHGHENMEILTVVLSGAIAHKDSMGQSEKLVPGEYQLMSAGAGVQHSEFNPSSNEELHLLQIWLQPNVFNGKPSYQQKAFSQEQGFVDIATPTASGDSFLIKQDAVIKQLILEPNTQQSLSIELSNKVFVQSINDELSVGKTELNSGDGLKITQESELLFSNNSSEKVKAIVFIM